MALLSFGLVGILLGWFHGTPATQVAGGSSASFEKSTETKLPQPPKAEIEDPNVLLVSHKPDGGGKYRTINEALVAVKPGQTIRVVDGGIYRERIVLNRPAAFDGITLEAVRGATLSHESAGTSIMDIVGVAHLRVRGFRWRTQNAPSSRFISVLGQCPDLRLERLDFAADGNLLTNAVELVGAFAGAGDQAPLLVRACVFRNCGIAVGMDGSTHVVSQVAVQACQFIECGTGLWLQHDVRRVQVAGNQFLGNTRAAVQFKSMAPGTQDLLFANNAFHDCLIAIRVAHREINGKDVQIRNNVILASRLMDISACDVAADGESPGDGTAVAQAYHFDHNWREGVPPGGIWTKGWIAPGPKDVRRDKIDGIDRNPNSLDFLRPAKDSPLAAQGAGNEDPTLPRYIGAVPPEGMEPWDWERAWRMPKDAQLLTVSQDETGGGKYRSIGDALKDAKPWATIRVLDDGVYREGLVLNRPKMQEGITLEAFRAATLEAVAKGLHLVTIVGVSNVTVRGFRLRVRNVPQTTLLGFHSRSPGLRLERLEFTGDRTASINAIEVLGDSGADDETNPVIIRHCVFRGVGVGIYVRTDAAHVASQLVVLGCEFADCRFGILLLGFCRHVGVLANRFVEITFPAIQFQGMAPETEDLLVVNNTCIDCGVAFRLWDRGVHGRHVRIRNNLFLASHHMDMQAVEGENETEFANLRNGAAAAQAYQIDYNWRESAVHTDAKDWIPPSAKDVCQVKIEGVNRDPKSPAFLLPAKDSPLATEGAGNEDPSLPRYVGALPPEGVAAWDWDRTWPMHVPKALPAK
jgi:nitrous oxidase accessory protein NosD